MVFTLKDVYRQHTSLTSTSSRKTARRWEQSKATTTTASWQLQYLYGCVITIRCPNGRQLRPCQKNAPASSAKRVYKQSKGIPNEMPLLCYDWIYYLPVKVIRIFKSFFSILICILHRLISIFISIVSHFFSILICVFCHLISIFISI